MEQGNRHEATWRNKIEAVEWSTGRTMEDRWRAWFVSFAYSTLAVLAFYNNKIPVNTCFVVHYDLTFLAVPAFS